MPDAQVHTLYPWVVCGSQTHEHVMAQVDEHVLLEGEECGCPMPHRTVTEPADVPAYPDDCPDC